MSSSSWALWTAITPARSHGRPVPRLPGPSRGASPRFTLARRISRRVSSTLTSISTPKKFSKKVSGFGAVGAPTYERGPHGASTTTMRRSNEHQPQQAGPASAEHPHTDRGRAAHRTRWPGWQRDRRRHRQRHGHPHQAHHGADNGDPHGNRHPHEDRFAAAVGDHRLTSSRTNRPITDAKS